MKNRLQTVLGFPGRMLDRTQELTESAGRTLLGSNPVTGRLLSTMDDVMEEAPPLKEASRLAMTEGIRDGMTRGALHLATESGVKGAQRFIPFVNWAFVGSDAVALGKALEDPEADALEKSGKVVQLAGSVASATGIPGVSQAGAAVSLGTPIALETVRWVARSQAEKHAKDTGDAPVTP